MWSALLPSMTDHSQGIKLNSMCHCFWSSTQSSCEYHLLDSPWHGVIHLLCCVMCVCLLCVHTGAASVCGHNFCTLSSAWAVQHRARRLSAVCGGHHAAHGQAKGHLPRPLPCCRCPARRYVSGYNSNISDTSTCASTCASLCASVWAQIVAWLVDCMH